MLVKRNFDNENENPNRHLIRVIPTGLVLIVKQVSITQAGLLVNPPSTNAETRGLAERGPIWSEW